MAIHYSNGGPGPATRLLRVNTDTGPNTADGFDAWVSASSEKWTAAGGWEPFMAQPDILYLGEYFMVDADQVPRIQAEIRERCSA